MTGLNSKIKVNETVSSNPEDTEKKEDYDSKASSSFLPAPRPDEPSGSRVQSHFRNKKYVLGHRPG